MATSCLIPSTLPGCRGCPKPGRGAFRTPYLLLMKSIIFVLRRKKSDVIELTNEQVNEIAGKTATESR
jgi:hypothetical protein